MAEAERRRFRTVGDWHNLLNEARAGDVELDLYALRRACYEEIRGLRERPLLVYAVQFPAPRNLPISIDLEDVDGFVDLINAVPEEHDAVDVLIHSPGGTPEATERIVELLRQRFDDVAFMVPHSAYSAATMLSLSGNEIILHSSASLGPIDPQINGVPARSIRRGFERVRDLLKDEGPEALPAYIPLIEKHSIEMLEICKDAEDLSKELVTEWLSDFMFSEMENGEEKTGFIKGIVDFFASYDDHKTHGRPLTYRKVRDKGLNLTLADGGLAELLREAHILISGFFNVSNFVKIYEGPEGLAWGRQAGVKRPPEPDKPEDGE